MCVLVLTSPSVELMLSLMTPLWPFVLLGEREEASVRSVVKHTHIEKGDKKNTVTS